MSLVFSTMSLLVAPLWLAMMLLPRERITQRLVASPLVVLPIALVYVALVVPVLGDLLPPLLRPELATIAALLGEERGATIAWAHFLAFDVFVGRWVFLDAQPRLAQRALSPWLLSPILFAVLMLGPLGLSLYLALRALDERSFRAKAVAPAG
jgi:hypothetical protein